jgi:hypothetical protein
MVRVYSYDERNNIYNSLMVKLLELDLFNSELESIKKLKIMAKLYRDNGMEFQGELELPNKKIITYEFWKDDRRQTNVNISKNINNIMTEKERGKLYSQIMENLKNENLLNSDDKNITELKKKALEYKTNGTEFSGELDLPSGKKLVCDLYNNHKNESKVIILGDETPLSDEERFSIYKEIVTSLKKLNIWDEDHENIAKLRHLAVKFKNEGIDEVGELPLPYQFKIIYEFHKNHNKKTFVKITRDNHSFYDKSTDNVVDDNVPQLCA